VLQFRDLKKKIMKERREKVAPRKGMALALSR
jgi:hypothetical protein